MRNVEVSDDRSEVWLTPELCRAARALLNWTPAHLCSEVVAATRFRLSQADLRDFEDHGVMLDMIASSAILATLLCKVELTTDEDECGVVRKPGVAQGRDRAYVQFGGPLVPRSPL